MNIKNFFNLIVIKKNTYVYLMICIMFFIDRISKNNIIQQLENKQRIYVNDYLNLDLIWNTGIGFGLFSIETTLLYHMMSFLIISVCLLIFYFAFKSDGAEKIFYSLIAGGALGNIYDRIYYYAVPDFIDLHYNEFHWFTFNIADIFISIGVILLIIKELIFKNEKN